MKVGEKPHLTALQLSSVKLPNEQDTATHVNSVHIGAEEYVVSFDEALCKRCQSLSQRRSSTSCKGEASEPFISVAVGEKKNNRENNVQEGEKLFKKQIVDRHRKEDTISSESAHESGLTVLLLWHSTLSIQGRSAPRKVRSENRVLNKRTHGTRNRNLCWSERPESVGRKKKLWTNCRTLFKPRQFLVWRSSFTYKHKTHTFSPRRCVTQAGVSRESLRLTTSRGVGALDFFHRARNRLVAISNSNCAHIEPKPSKTPLRLLHTKYRQQAKTTPPLESDKIHWHANP